MKFFYGFHKKNYFPIFIFISRWFIENWRIWSDHRFQKSYSEAWNMCLKVSLLFTCCRKIYFYNAKNSLSISNKPIMILLRMKIILKCMTPLNSNRNIIFYNYFNLLSDSIVIYLSYFISNSCNIFIHIYSSCHQLNFY